MTQVNCPFRSKTKKYRIVITSVTRDHIKNREENSPAHKNLLTVRSMYGRRRFI